jgi:hypothetical protein
MRNRQTFGMCVRFNDGCTEVRSLTLPELRESLRANRDASNLVSPAFTVAQAMRDIMDEQCFEIHFNTFKVVYEKD